MDVDNIFFCYPFKDYLPKAIAYICKAAQEIGKVSKYI